MIKALRLFLAPLKAGFILRLWVLMGFILSFFIPIFAHADVIFNEVAWMGTENSSADEWIELYNSGTDDVNLSGWGIFEGGGETLIEPLSGTISADGYFLIERTDDDSVPNIPASQEPSSWGGYGLNDSGEHLVLKNASGEIVNSVNAQDGWPAGDKSTKQTMQWDGMGWITADATPLAPNPVSQAEEGLVTEKVTIAQSGYLPVPVENKSITAVAGDDKTVIVGADSEFRGEAYGLKGEPLSGARFLWNFGDGTIKEGQAVTHNYSFSGTYMVVLNVSVGRLTSTDSMKVTAMPNKLFISEIKPGVNSWVEIYNPSDALLDLSGWMLRSSGKTFAFPGSTLILPKTFLAVPESVSGIPMLSFTGSADLLYPNGFIADVFPYNKILGRGYSFNKHNNSFVIGLETPGGPFEALPIDNNQYSATTDDSQNQNVQKVIDKNQSLNDQSLANNVATSQSTVINNKMVAAVGGENSSLLTWFLLSSGVGIVGAAGFVILRRMA